MVTVVEGQRGHLADSSRLLTHDSFYRWVTNVDELRAAFTDKAHDIILDAGTYTLPEGVGLLLSGNQRVRGAGRERTFIVSENAYAFSAPASGSCDRVIISDLSCSLKAGSTSGGAIRALSDGYHADWALEHVYGNGVITSDDPLFDLHGAIGSYIYQCQAGGGQVGFRIGTDGFPSNAMVLRDSRASSCFVAGIELVGGGLHRIEDCIIENNGIGVSADGVAMVQVTGGWFENQGATDILLKGIAHGRVLNNKLHYHMPASISPHIALVNCNHVELIGNYGADPSGARIGVTIDAPSYHNLLTANVFADPVFIEDNGTGTVMFQQPSGYGIVPNITPQPYRSGTLGYYGTPRPAMWLQQIETQLAPIFLAETLDNDLLASISKNGYIVGGVNTAPPNGEIGVGQFTFWLDPTPGAVKLKIVARNANGATLTGELPLT